MEIIISKEPETLNVSDEMIIEIKRAVELVGNLYDASNSEVSITLTDDKTIHELNKKYRGVDRATDVLSFAFRESDEPEILFNEETTIDDEIGENNNDEIVDMLGEIIISVERAEMQAVEYGHSLKREITFLTVHGMLHLLGYDHIEEADRIEMETEQKFIMNKLGIDRS